MQRSLVNQYRWTPRKVPGGVGFSWHGVVVRLDTMLFDVSLPPITILHLSAPSARLVLRVKIGIEIECSAYSSNRIFERYAIQARSSTHSDMVLDS